MKPDEAILGKCRKVLEQLYGERLQALILYGSSAREMDTSQSDIDLMVVLDGPVNVGLEIRRIWDVLYPVQLESDRIISVMPADGESFKEGGYALYRNVLREGVPI